MTPKPDGREMGHCGILIQKVRNEMRNQVCWRDRAGFHPGRPGAPYTPEATVEQSYLNVEWSDLNVWPLRFDLKQMRGMWVIPREQTLFRWMGCEMM